MLLIHYTFLYYFKSHERERLLYKTLDCILILFKQYFSPPELPDKVILAVVISNCILIHKYKITFSFIFIFFGFRVLPDKLIIATHIWEVRLILSTVLNYLCKTEFLKNCHNNVTQIFYYWKHQLEYIGKFWMWIVLFCFLVFTFP